MFYKYESDFDNDLMFWSNATADLWHKGESGESDLPDELLHALNELWTDSHLVCCYLVEFKGRYGVALESIYDRDFAESLGVTYTSTEKMHLHVAAGIFHITNIGTQKWRGRENLLVMINRHVPARRTRLCITRFLRFCPRSAAATEAR